MPNNLATLSLQLSIKLRDTDHSVWNSTEKDDLVTWATDMLFQDRPRAVQEIVVLADNDDQYTLATVQDVFRIDILDSDDKMLMPLPRGTWELWGDSQSPSQTLYVNPRYAKTDWTLRVHGYAPYDLTTNFPPNREVPLILAEAAAEATRRVIHDRARFEQWAHSNQIANISVNELIQMANEFEREAELLRNRLRIIHKPKPGRM